MYVLRAVVVVAVVAAIATSSAGAGGGAAPVYPALVNTEMVRVQKLLVDATAYQDEGQPDKAVAALTATRAHLRKAWTAEKYLIDNAPPPVAASSSVAKSKAVAKPKAAAKAGATARASGGAVPGASPYADQYTTGVAVLSLDHDVASTAIGMLDGASGPLLAAANSTLFAALNAQDTSIAYIHSKDVPPPAAASSSVPTSAHASGGAIAGTWGTVMPGAAPFIDDELQQIRGVRASTPGQKPLLDAAEVQDTKTASTMAKYWPPVVGG
jgi:hypothetical protein